jgi:uncharacterized protein (DUF302 family)
VSHLASGDLRGVADFEGADKRRNQMIARMVATVSAVLIAGVLLFSMASPRADNEDGIVRVKSAYPLAETVTRLKKDVADKGIMFFSEIDQSELAAKAGIKLLPSTLLVFGNPPLGIQFLTSNPDSGLDWPVRLLVHQDANGDVWAVYTDFDWIARRHHIKDRGDAFKMASMVIQSITSSVKEK